MNTTMHHEFTDRDIITAAVRIYDIDLDQPHAERIERMPDYEDANGAVVMIRNERGVWRLDQLWRDLQPCNDPILVSEAHRVVASVVADLRQADGSWGQGV